MGSPAYVRLVEAETAWERELRRAFPAEYPGARYYPKGRGEPGSALRAAFDRRADALVACGFSDPRPPFRALERREGGVM